MGDPTIEVTDENRDAAQEAKIKAMEAISEGKLAFFSLLIYLALFQLSLVVLMYVH